jgi:2-amino-4-hydroxy-6-hydroxymethyldihydropteridine diphosphokinase
MEAMAEHHQAYLNLGSNIEPQVNLPRAIELLRANGQVEAVSNAWETHAIGSEGPNFLNACLRYLTPFSLGALKWRILRPLEAQLGRERTADKHAPRPIDIDIVLFDKQLVNPELWRTAFLAVPLAELYPNYQPEGKVEKLAQVAERLRSQVWIVARPEVLSQLEA